MEDTGENEVLGNVRAALVAALAFYIPHCEESNERVPDVLHALTSGIVNLLFEVELDPVGLRLSCSLRNASSGESGFLFEIESPDGAETVQ